MGRVPGVDGAIEGRSIPRLGAAPKAARVHFSSVSSGSFPMVTVDIRLAL